MSSDLTGPLFLGLDLSTQQLKAIVIAQDATLVHESAVHFDNDLPSYGTTNGAVCGPGDREVTSPVAMWLEAIDLLFDRLKNAGVEVRAISAISGAGQQHGSVYWSQSAEALLSSLDPTKPLVSQLSPGAFSLPTAPIWQDSSTTQECRSLEQFIGGPQALADLTGSRAYERFTGNQIAKIRRLQPDAYASTSRISLVSSFIPSVFLGRIVAVDISDASGMNLMDVITCKWNDALLEACGGPELRSKLGPEPEIGGTVLGTVSKWWVERYGLKPGILPPLPILLYSCLEYSSECIVAPFTGDNPASVIALSAPGDAVLSLGTSTTFLLSIPGADTPPKRFTTSHLLSHPTDIHGKIAMLCYKNGALAREQVRDRYADHNWARFNELVEASPPGNNGNFGLYFPLPEIIPPDVVGQHTFHIENLEKGVAPLAVDDIPASTHPRAILESQFLSIRSRIADILPQNSPPLQRLVATGGSSANQTIRQIAADIFGMKVFVSSTKEAAGMGGALLAKYAWWKAARGGNGTLEDMTRGEITGLQCVAEPREEVSDVFEKLVDVYRACEEQVVSKAILCFSTVNCTQSLFIGSSIRLASKQLILVKSFSSSCNRRDMEGPTALKRTLHEADISDSATKRLKATDPMSVDSPPLAPPTNAGVHPNESFSSLTGADAPGNTLSVKERAEDAKAQITGKNAQGKSRKEPKEKRVGRRNRRGTRNDEAAEGNETLDHPKAPRLPKRQCALLIGFCGSGYSGMQIQPDHKTTIEGVLFQAMVRAGAVSQDNADDPISLARAARTDAGVHAAGNLVSLKMITMVPDVPDMVARINEELPPEIRLWGYVRRLALRPPVRSLRPLFQVRVQNSFNARLVCDSRKYTYFFPTYLLIPPTPGSGLDRSLQQYAATLPPDSQSPAVDQPKNSHPFWEGDLGSYERELVRKRSWRVGSEQVERLRQTARKFEGTHNFHNFTVGRDFSDRSNQRHMKKIEIFDPVVYGDTEWISVLFHGQSFMLHQRKMMSALVLSCRTDAPEQVIEELYGPSVVFIPKMPSLGLLLEEPIFDSYNTRMAAINEKLDPSDPDYRPSISFEAHRDAIHAFKQKYIYDNMRQVEDRDGLFDAWMRHVDAYSGNDLLYLNPKGTIPPAAIIKKNERRDNPFREKKRFDATSFSVDEDEKAKSMADEDDEEPPISKKDLADTEG
ncbi:hypothetical protein D9615_003543 [Tricholomella constricta]|uniref:xylulokinase n=1 Tax=Tricholomella constricta TaxID=117010 RepID=A0A8H5M7R5_9AGAR|nr:hypothetical protein D9615_003543 [Tricholomella constricta]